MRSSPVLLALCAVLLTSCRGDEIRSARIDDSPALVGGGTAPRALVGDALTHPHLAPPGRSTIHTDGANSDVHPYAGPMGVNPQVRSIQGSTMPGGMCATLTPNREGLLVAFCASIAGFELSLLEPRTMKLLARHELTNRPSTFAALVTFDPDKIMADTSGGAYFYLDDQDRAVLADARQHLLRIGHRRNEAGEWEFHVENDWDLSAHVPHDCLSATNWFPDGECDPMTAVIPDHDGRIWWITLHGRIGTLDPSTGEVASMQLEGEEIQNSLAAAEDAIYVVSDHALYALEAGADGTPQVLARSTFDRGSGRKLGAIHQGSGTTPTLIGDDYIVIGDNADERVNILVYRRDLEERALDLLCSTPVFDAGGSAVENSVIGWGRTIIVKNDFGYTNGFQMSGDDWDSIEGGVSRIDIRADESGCDLVWRSDEKVPSVVPKFSAANGIAYFYGFTPQEDGENAWYLVGIDAHSGETAFKILTGGGSGFDGSWAPITITPDGTAYIGTLAGLVAIWDDP